MNLEVTKRRSAFRILIPCLRSTETRLAGSLLLLRVFFFSYKAYFQIFSESISKSHFSVNCQKVISYQTTMPFQKGFQLRFKKLVSVMPQLRFQKPLFDPPVKYRNSVESRIRFRKRVFQPRFKKRFSVKHRLRFKR